MPADRPSSSERGFAFVGCFTTAERQARGEGITVFRTGASKGWEVASVLGGIPNPSSLLFDRRAGVLFAAHGDGDFASSYSFDRKAGTLRLLGKAKTGAMNGVSLALDSARSLLFIANYSSGSVSTLPVAADGTLRDATHTLVLSGTLGPHRIEQMMPRPHDTVFDPSGRYLVVCEKGLDRIFVLAADAGGRLTVLSSAAMRAGAGPRHIAFHPALPLAFVVNEIDSTVATLAWNADAATLTPIHVVAALPPDFFGDNTASEIVVGRDGRSVYASHRGADLITHLALNGQNNGLSVVDWTSSGGRTPRFMALGPGGDALFVANEQSDCIAGFSIAPTTGRLAPASRLATPSPAAIAFS